MPTHEERVLVTLRALAQKLESGVCYQESAPKLSHYRELTEPIIQSYDVLRDGAQLIHATATKFALVGKIDIEKTQPLQDQLIQGCELVATGCVAICSDVTGCARSTRRYARQASRSIVQSVISLVEAIASYSRDDPNDIINAIASKTGVVWEACDYVVNKKLPMGNRNAIRRDLLRYKMECQETLKEFQHMIDEGPCQSDNTHSAEELPTENRDNLWEEFLSGQTDQYSETEFSVALPCLSLLKCTRGSLNIAIDAMDDIGKHPAGFELITRLFDKAALVGEGLTDLGASLYPPLDFDAVEKESKRQVTSCRGLLEFVHESKAGEHTNHLSEETWGLVEKVTGALENREREILEAISLTQR